MCKITCDEFLDGRLLIEQPKYGYRAATDPLLLAAIIPARAGQNVLDVGCGVGVASLGLASRILDIIPHGIEIQPDYAELARRNSKKNGFNMIVHTGDLASLSIEMRNITYDHVMTNPPFFKSSNLSLPQNEEKVKANVESLDLNNWISLSLKRLRSQGSFSIIHLASRLPEILMAITDKCGDIRVLPIASRIGRPAKRVIVHSIKGSKAPMQLLPPLILHKGRTHEKDGDDYTAQAYGILRAGRSLNI